jgi:hypothetical protein
MTGPRSPEGHQALDRWLLTEYKYSDAYCNQIFQSVQQFWRWYAPEEDVPNVMLG